jgi:serine/threonine-protein kinase
MRTFEGVEIALVPAGCFMMGREDGSDNEQPVHEVCFDEPFWIDIYEVTNAQYGSSGEWEGDNRPRERVSWHDAVAHCESRGARLPTEAEWEYAARGPDGLVYPWGDSFIRDNVVYSGNSHRQTAAVGSRPDGASWVGALDMGGNVWEWVADWYGTYPSEAQVNPGGPSSGSERVLRGGSWLNYPDSLRGDQRVRLNPDFTYDDDGFRCALSD